MEPTSCVQTHSKITRPSPTRAADTRLEAPTQCVLTCTGSATPFVANGRHCANDSAGETAFLDRVPTWRPTQSTGDARTARSSAAVETMSCERGFAIRAAYILAARACVRTRSSTSFRFFFFVHPLRLRRQVQRAMASGTRARRSVPARRRNRCHARRGVTAAHVRAAARASLAHVVGAPSPCPRGGTEERSRGTREYLIGSECVMVDGGVW